LLLYVLITLLSLKSDVPSTAVPNGPVVQKREKTLFTPSVVTLFGSINGFFTIPRLLKTFISIIFEKLVELLY
jgi:hypothetical protein